MEYVIFLNGLYPKNINKLKKIVKDKMIISVDGGTNFCYKMNLIPNVIIGDLDSIDEQILEFYKNKKISIIKSIEEKDYTDFELALKYIENEKIIDLNTRFKDKKEILDIKVNKKILVLGATGKRIDMTLSNIAKLQNNSNMTFITEEFEFIRYVKLKNNIEKIENLKNHRFSIIPITTLNNLELKGFKYNLSKTNINKSIGLVSNIVKDEMAYIYCLEGEMYLIYE